VGSFDPYNSSHCYGNRRVERQGDKRRKHGNVILFLNGALIKNGLIGDLSARSWAAYRELCLLASMRVCCQK